MVPSYDMYSPAARHQTSTYGLAQNYGHHQSYTQYTDNINFNPCGMMDSGMNNNYQQNLPSSWPIYTVSPTNNPSRQHVLLEDWMPLTTSPGTYQTQSVMQFSTDNAQTYHLQRNIGDVGPADYSLASSGHMRIQEKLEPSSETHDHPSSDSVVAVSSDGMSGSESPILPIHVNHSTGNSLCRPQPARSPYEWIKRTSYQSQPNPGRTRTKDKYRIVYTDHQRLELEKEFHYSRYITIRRKVELAASLNLSERQIKIWFQNRRAKERRQAKKREELLQKNKDAQVVYQHTNALNIANISIY